MQNEKIHKRGRYAAEFKEKVALEALTGAKTHTQIASEYGISPDLVYNGYSDFNVVIFLSSGDCVCIHNFDFVNVSMCLYGKICIPIPACKL